MIVLLIQLAQRTYLTRSASIACHQQNYQIAFKALARPFSQMKIIKPNWVNEGVGAKVIRIIGNQHFRHLDPFLMLDYFHVKLPAGFPDHPHRGFETITYMKQGSFYHEDCHGHHGIIGPGDVQWMTAGKGIIHSQIPASSTQLSIGFQLWLNLQAKQKMTEAGYQQFQGSQFPVFKDESVSVKILSGQFKGIKSPIKLRTKVLYLDISLSPSSKIEVPIDPAWSTLLFVYRGGVLVNKQLLQENYAAVFSKQTPELVVIQSKSDSSLVLISGEKLREQVVQHGPFVMNSKQQIQQTIRDYQQGRNGFEKGGWSSQIKQLMKNPKKKISFIK